MRKTITTDLEGRVIAIACDAPDEGASGEMATAEPETETHPEDPEAPLLKPRRVRL